MSFVTRFVSAEPVICSLIPPAFAAAAALGWVTSKDASSLAAVVTGEIAAAAQLAAIVFARSKVTPASSAPVAVAAPVAPVDGIPPVAPVVTPPPQ